MELQEIVSEADGWHRRALIALEERDDELAGQALLRKERCMERSLDLRTQWNSQRATAEALKRSLHAAMARVEKVKRECSSTLERLRSAEAQKKIADTLDASPADSPLLVLKDLNARVLELEAETEAALELSGDSLGDELEQRFSELESRRRASESLEELKTELRNKESTEPMREAREEHLDVD
jgi:phage shock protein A